MIRHRFINDGKAPIPMGSAAEYACACGRRGTYAAIERHVAESAERADTAPEVVVEVDDFGGGDTKAHYLPIEPRRPALTGESNPLPRPESPVATEPDPAATPPCPTCAEVRVICDLPEICAWVCGHWITKHPRSIAEAFQDMLRSAFQAGTAASATGESFETWYQREVLR